MLLKELFVTLQYKKLIFFTSDDKLSKVNFASSVNVSPLIVTLEALIIKSLVKIVSVFLVDEGSML